MTLLIVAAALALIGLWITVCRIDRNTSFQHIAAAVMMTIGASIIFGWGLGVSVITATWLTNGGTALLFGLSIWLAFDRRAP